MAEHAAQIPLKKRLLTAGALATSVLLMALGVSQVAGGAAHAAGALFSCDENTLYGINSSGAFDSINATTGAATVLRTQSPSNNALGITQGGGAAYATLNSKTATASGTITKYDPVADSTTKFSAYVPSATYRGAVDPSTSIYYYAQGNATKAAVYAFNTKTDTPIGQVGYLDFAQASTGDFAFSTTGVLYAVSGSQVVRVDGTLPTTVSTTSELSTTEIANLGSVTASPGIAFSTNGFLYVAVNGTIEKINPVSGTTVATNTITDSNGTFTPTDLASCNYADGLSAQTSVDQRWKSADQFTLTIQGGANNTLSDGNTATTTGSATGTQAVTAGADLVTAGNAYTVTQTAAPGSGTDLTDYDTTWACTSASGKYGVNGLGDTATVTLPSTRDDDVSCLFTNTLVAKHVVGQNDQYSTPTNTAIDDSAASSPSVLDNDSGTGLTITGNSDVSHGTLSFDTTTGHFTYTPNNGFAGTDSFTYTVADPSGQSMTPTVTLIVGPTAVADQGTVTVGGSVTTTAANGVLANDQGTGLTASNASAPAHGTVTLDSDGSYTYTSTGTYSGIDTWTYVVTDAGGHHATGTVHDDGQPQRGRRHTARHAGRHR
ncbi:hypothetical protein AX769_00340 [Frondihabitans sp. PAMC 28766]|uniref:Ig-like domain-containing protein n=1 Tax=Frondihabitans sp. PAMC 28766 TaxID=1795630 RepID=UPI00078C7A66|nr:Ig-like domain-containing protein [Frondihabitans sp. PAMC 28766]AMM18870.1 hypothetical protein AX769_00340 [Frondihabitans sp. PAMC 28766]